MKWGSLENGGTFAFGELERHWQAVRNISGSFAADELPVGFLRHGWLKCLTIASLSRSYRVKVLGLGFGWRGLLMAAARAN